MRFWVLGVIALVLAGPAEAATTIKPAAQAATLKVVDIFVIPRFKAITEAAKAQQQAWTAYCADPAHGQPQTLLQAYARVTDAWSDIDFLRMGPATAEMRIERINYWLDRENATGKALDGYLNAPKNPDSAAVIAGSVAGQGLPLLERLLYPNTSLMQLASNPRRCATGRAVAENVASIAATISSEWNNARAALVANKAYGVAFYDATEASSVLLTDLASGIEVLKDSKIALLFHDVANPAAPLLADGARSGRTLRDIVRNLSAIHQAIDMFMVRATAKQKQDVSKAFADMDRDLKAIAASAKKPRKAQMVIIQKALETVMTLRVTVTTVLPEATGIQLGFNNLDGD